MASSQKDGPWPLTNALISLASRLAKGEKVNWESEFTSITKFLAHQAGVPNKKPDKPKW